MCRWPLRAPIVYSVANYRPHLSHFWANMYFSRSQLSHFLFLWIDPFFKWNEEHFIFRLQYLEKSENVQPPYSQSSRENVTPSSRASPLACYKEVPPTPRDPIPDQKVQNLYPFSDQKGAKTILFGAAHTYMAYIRVCPPPPLHRPPPQRHIVHTLCPLKCRQPYTLLRLITTLFSRMSSNFAFQ